MDDHPGSKWAGRGGRARDISIAVDDEYEEQDEQTRGYRGGGSSLANSMLEVGQDQGFGRKT